MIEYFSENSTLADRYRITEFISKGAMGAVYKAFDIRLKCPVAVKQNLMDINISYHNFSVIETFVHSPLNYCMVA
jgi:serine/threonine protein kinase